MFCTRCGIEVEEKARFCPQCGTATPNAGPRAISGNASSRLSRPREESDIKLAGVCAGVARYIGLDVTLVRILWLLLAVWPPFLGVIAYLVCWIVMPKDPLLLAAPSTKLDVQSAT
jgi:phage shock protein C